MLQFIKRTLGGDESAAQPASGKRTWAGGVVLTLVTVAAAGLWLSHQLERVRPGPVQAQLQTLGERLSEAERKADAARANALLDETGAVMRKLNEQAGATQLHDCRLAASHLVTGVVAVGQGSSWSSRLPFEAALKDCRA